MLDPAEFDMVNGPTDAQIERLSFCLTVRAEAQKEIDQFASCLDDFLATNASRVRAKPTDQSARAKSRPGKPRPKT